MLAISQVKSFLIDQQYTVGFSSEQQSMQSISWICRYLYTWHLNTN